MTTIAVINIFWSTHFVQNLTKDGSRFWVWTIENMQLHFTSSRTRVVSLEVWILQIMVWTIITCEMSTMVHNVFRGSGPHLSHTCPNYMHHIKRQRIRTTTKFVGLSVGHSEKNLFCSSYECSGVRYSYR